jgi:hypothetical protein
MKWSPGCSRPKMAVLSPSVPPELKTTSASWQLKKRPWSRGPGRRRRAPAGRAGGSRRRCRSAPSNRGAWPPSPPAAEGWWHWRPYRLGAWRILPPDSRNFASPPWRGRLRMSTIPEACLTNSPAPARSRLRRTVLHFGIRSRMASIGDRLHPGAKSVRNRTGKRGFAERGDDPLDGALGSRQFRVKNGIGSADHPECSLLLLLPGG